MRLRMSVGSAPWGEDCAQLGSSNYRVRALAETAAYLRQLKRLHGNPPAGSTLYRMWREHDFGRYLDCEVSFDADNPAAAAYAADCESKQPELWDSEAREELEIEDEQDCGRGDAA